jgi:hypothetical protein
MKTILYFAPILAALCSTTLVAATKAEPTAGPGVMMSIQTIDNNGWEVTRGMAAKTVLSRLGKPDRKIAPDVWVYAGYGTARKERSFGLPFAPGRTLGDDRGYYTEQNQSEPPANLTCDRLVITIADDKVVDIQLANCAAVTILANNGGRLPKDANRTIVADN